jgi:ribosomal protein S18 acetylase RimI-like enzyme
MLFRQLEINDAKAVASLHKKAFTNFFLTKLGSKFLEEFYKAIFESSYSLSVGVFEDNKLLGFAVGARKNQGFYSSILKNNFIRLGIAASLALIKNPKLVYRLFISLNSSNTYNDNFVKDSILLSICVEPNCSEKGFGKLLLINFEKLAFRHSESIILTTDAEKNDSVNKFYIRNGYILTYTFYQGNRRMNFYKKTNRQI